MRKTFFILLALSALTTLSLGSCLQYDEPGDEFETGQLRPGDSAVTAKPAVAQPDFGE